MTAVACCKAENPEAVMPQLCQAFGDKMLTLLVHMLDSFAHADTSFADKSRKT